MKKKLSLGQQLTSFLEYKNGQKENNRNGINNIATKFYRNLYDLLSTPTPMNNRTRTPTTVKMGDFSLFLPAEIGSIVKHLKKNKPPEDDGVTNKHIIYGGTMLITLLTTLFNKIIETGTITKEWEKSEIIFLFKNGNRHRIEIYSPISLFPTIAKIFVGNSHRATLLQS